MAGELPAPTATGSSRWWARRSCGSGSSTSSAARWPSATGGWVSTRSSWSAPAGRTRCRSCATGRPAPWPGPTSRSSSAACLVAVAVLMAGTAIWATRVDRVAVVDVVWGMAFAVVAIVASFVAQAESEGPVDPDLALRRFVTTLIVVIWAARLASHIRAAQRRARRGPPLREDARRYAVAGRHRTGDPQGVRRAGHRGLVRVAARSRSAPWSRCAGGPSSGSASACGLVGLVFEAVGDRQLAAYKALPEGPEAAGHADRAVALHPPPQLLRRRVRARGASGWSVGSRRGRCRRWSRCWPRWR